MRVGELHPVTPVPRARGQLREALGYVKARPELWLTLALVFFVATFGMNFQVTTALMSRGVFHRGAAEFGLASAMYALGALGGALVSARRAKPSMRLLLVAAFAFGVLETVAGLMPVFWLFLVMLVPTGLAVMMFTITANSATQLGTTAAVRGRVMGLYMLVFLGGAPLGSPMVGWVAEQFGARMSLIAGGVISAVAAVGVALLLARGSTAPPGDSLPRGHPGPRWPRAPDGPGTPRTPDGAWAASRRASSRVLARAGHFRPLIPAPGRARGVPLRVPGSRALGSSAAGCAKSKDFLLGYRWGPGG